jgi:hypothetical protein
MKCRILSRVCRSSTLCANKGSGADTISNPAIPCRRNLIPQVPATPTASQLGVLIPAMTSPLN